MHIGTVGLIVRDLESVLAFYRDVIGLQVHQRDASGARLGVGGVDLLTLEHRSDSLPDDARTAGLYHTAFLQPTRTDLARWLINTAQNSVPLTGASDHAVSEAIYLDDPEGNGVEVYRDRNPDEWRWEGDQVHMITEPLDLAGLAATARGDAAYHQAPDGLRIGHVHLRVGDIATAEGFYRDLIGLDVTRRRHGASFMSSGGYHHHVATNIWHSRGAGARDERRAGLAWFTVETADRSNRAAIEARLADADTPVAPIPGGFEAADPWGNRVRINS
jgi:catechol 2,3-dioxygenase